MNFLKHFPYAFLFYSLTAFSQKDCTLKIEKDSISVYTCKVENLRFNAVRTSFLVNSRPSQLAAMVMDIEQYGNWQYNTVSTIILKRISDHEIIYYTEISAPFPASNRDFIIRLTLDQNPVTREIIIDLVSLPDYLPTKEKVVRVPFSKARWTVTPYSGAQLKVDYYIEIDLGGAVPAWLVNFLSYRAPYETFKDMRAGIGRYRNRSAAFIRD